jgi:hypothetical protein
MSAAIYCKPLQLVAAATILMGVFSNCVALAGEKAAPGVPKGKTVYDAPDPLPPGKHGDLIWATEIKTDIPGARAWKVLYRSTDIHDTAVPVSGMVIAPDSKAPANGHPVISWAHGTTGIARNCAPTMVDNPAKDATFYMLPDSPDRMNSGVPGLTQMIAAGYVVAAADYNGLGAPGFHQYMIGPTAGRNVLDAAVAAQHIPAAGAGKRMVVLGWSQGGQAAVWAAQLADYVTGLTEVLGAAALAPVNALEQIKIQNQMIAEGKKLPGITSSETIMAWYAMSAMFPELKLRDVLTPFGIGFIKESAKCQCSHHMGASLAYMQAWKGNATRPDPQNQEAWLKRIEQMALGNVPAQVPISIYQGDDDLEIFPAATEAYVKKACASGTTISYSHYADTDHLRVPVRAQADFLSWIADRFADKSAPSSCK